MIVSGFAIVIDFLSEIKYKIKICYRRRQKAKVKDSGKPKETIKIELRKLESVKVKEV